MDGWNSMIRYYKNNFSDGFRQVQYVQIIPIRPTFVMDPVFVLHWGYSITMAVWITISTGLINLKKILLN